VPKASAVVSCEGTTMARFAVPSITTVEVPREEIAAEALAALTEERSEWLHVVSNEGFRLVTRESCGCVPQDRRLASRSRRGWPAGAPPDAYPLHLRGRPEGRPVVARPA
jgi:hypothetical protein